MAGGILVAVSAAGERGRAARAAAPAIERSAVRRVIRERMGISGETIGPRACDGKSGSRWSGLTPSRFGVRSLQPTNQRLGVKPLHLGKRVGGNALHLSVASGARRDFFPRLTSTVKKRLLIVLGGFAAAALGFVALLYAFGAALRPDVFTPPTPPPAAELARIEAARADARRLDLAHPPVLARDVDYSLGARAPWWPKHEAPVLAELVREGK